MFQESYDVPIHLTKMQYDILKNKQKQQYADKHWLFYFAGHFRPQLFYVLHLNSSVFFVLLMTSYIGW